MRNEYDKTQNDLDWLAFCYIANELDQPHRDEFELRLAVDQQAREAVVTAMEHAQLLDAVLESRDQLPAGKSDHVSERKSAYSVSITRFSRKLIGTAAALLLIATGLMWLAESPVFRSEYSGIARAVDPHAALAFAWAGSLELADEFSADPFEASGLTEVAFEMDATTDDELAGVDDWMVLALVDLETGDTPDLPDEEEN